MYPLATAKDGPLFPTVPVAPTFAACCTHGSTTRKGTLTVSVKVVVDAYIINNAAMRVQALFRCRQERRKYLQVRPLAARACV